MGLLFLVARAPVLRCSSSPPAQPSPDSGNSRESMGIPGNLGNSRYHFPELGIPLPYRCTAVQYSSTVHVYRRGRSKKRSTTASQNRTSAHPDKKYVDRPTDGPTDRPTDRPTHRFSGKRHLSWKCKHQLFVDLLFKKRRTV